MSGCQRPAETAGDPRSRVTAPACRTSAPESRGTTESLRSVTVAHVLSEGAHTAARVPKGDVMRDPDSFDLDVLLRSAATVQRDPAAEKRLFSDVWSRVQASIGDGAASSLDAAQQRRLNVIGDREVAARRRRRAARLASAALAVAVAGGGTAVAAEFISTRTGEELTGWEVEAGGPARSSIWAAPTGVPRGPDPRRAALPPPGAAGACTGAGARDRRAGHVHPVTAGPGAFRRHR